MHKHILYLASGSSHRFGENKLLYHKDGKPLFLHTLEMLCGLVQSREDCSLTVVSRYEEIRKASAALGITAVDSPESQKGVSYTIKAGLNALGAVPGEDYLLFVVADQPKLRQSSVEKLLTLADTKAKCASLCYGDQPGNPTLFSAHLIPELMALEGDTGGRAVLRRQECIFVPPESQEELQDIDRKTDIN